MSGPPLRIQNDLKVFKSDLVIPTLLKVVRDGLWVFFGYLTSDWVDYSALLPAGVSVVHLLGLYVLLLLFRVSITNSNLKIESEAVVIQSSLLKGFRKRRFLKKEIQEIVFKDEWSESFLAGHPSIARFLLLWSLPYFIPYEYKWIDIKTKKGKRYRYYFFGVEYDSCDNDDQPLFEALFIALALTGLKVKWKSTKDLYFQSIQETAEAIYRSKNTPTPPKKAGDNRT